AFYQDVVGLPLAFEVPERGAAFLWIGEPGTAMLGLWTYGSAPLSLSLHLALATPLEQVLVACERLRSFGVTPLSFFATAPNEPGVMGWMPAAAVSSRAPDGPLLEYLAMLDVSARPELEILPWWEWRARTNVLPPARPRSGTAYPAGLI